jgi:DNA repair protein RecN (Recombination protein N)
MLDELVVRNLGIIEEARLCPGSGFCVITGETGAGKTLLLGAIRLLLGSNPRSELVGPFGEEALIEGRFQVGEDELVLSRRLQRGGRSRAYRDGAVASSRALGEALSGVVEVIGQHDHLSLTRPAEVRALLDSVLDRNGRRMLDEYRGERKKLEELLTARERLGGDQRALVRELDLVRFQASEISKATFRPGEDVELEQRAVRLRHSEELIFRLNEARTEAETAGDSIGRLTDQIRKAARLDSSLDVLADKAGMLGEAAADLGREVRLTAEGMVWDPEDQEMVDARLNLLGELRRKYGPGLEDVLAFGKVAAARAIELTELLGNADTIDVQIAAAQHDVMEGGSKLRAARQKAALTLSKEARKHLLDLGFDNPTIEAEVVEAVPGAWGADQVRLLFASDRRLEPAEVTRVASGGELSRLVLSLRLAAGRRTGPVSVSVFDEIDAGIGGATALAMGRKLASLAKDRQVLCVTHLPQVAAFADHHYVIERAEAKAHLVEATGDARTAEISRMLAGLPDSERGREAAAELLAMASADGDP